MILRANSPGKVRPPTTSTVDARRRLAAGTGTSSESELKFGDDAFRLRANGGDLSNSTTVATQAVGTTDLPFLWVSMPGRTTKRPTTATTVSPRGVLINCQSSFVVVDTYWMVPYHTRTEDLNTSLRPLRLCTGWYPIPQERRCKDAMKLNVGVDSKACNLLEHLALPVADTYRMVPYRATTERSIASLVDVDMYRMVPYPQQQTEATTLQSQRRSDVDIVLKAGMQPTQKMREAHKEERRMMVETRTSLRKAQTRMTRDFHFFEFTLRKVHKTTTWDYIFGEITHEEQYTTWI
jgi:hypothetical protein